MTDALPAYVHALLDPGAYPDPPEVVDLVQTHISYVFIAGDVVYKTKKPVDFGFISQLTLDIREAFCRAEVRLNTRLTRNVYLGVVPILRSAENHYTIGDPLVPNIERSEVVEWAVKMRRLPDDRTLDRVLASEQAPPNVVARLVPLLIAFHEDATVVANEPAYAGGQAERAWWAREYAEATPYIGDTWRAEDAGMTRAFFDATIEAEQALFDARLAAGCVVEGHGDLQAKHVYLLGARDPADEIAIVDCIEFSDWFHFRYLDVGYDIAFLAMDLEAQGYPDLGDELAGRYLAARHDETLGLLQPLHRAMRAFVRGKVESIGAHAPELPTAEQARLAASAARYFALAAEYAERRAGPSLVLLCGLPGTGKSTVGGTLAARIGAVYVSSDTVRKELAGLDPRTRAGAADREGLYAADITDRTYTELRRRADEHLAAGRSVVIDAMHGRASERAAALDVANNRAVPALLVELRLDEAEALARIELRQGDPLRTSDATREIYEAQRARFEPLQGNEGRHVVVDGAMHPAILARLISEALPHTSDVG